MKHLMSIGTRVGAFGDSAKAVQIQLPLERGNLGVAKVPRQNIRHEAIIVSDRKGVARRQPRDNRGIFLAQHVH